MAAYRGQQFIAAQIASILGQLSDVDELIVVDDGSTDETCQIVESFGDSRIRLERHNLNQGTLRSFEDAIGMAHGDIVFLSDQDDLWEADKVATVMREFEAHPDVDIAVSDAVLIDQNGDEVGSSYYALRGKFQTGLWVNIFRCKYLGCTMAFRSRILGYVLPFPRSRKILHDVWIGTATALMGSKVLYIDRRLVRYRRHAGNVTGNLRLSIAHRIRIRWDLCRALFELWLKSRFASNRT